jgi:hypothetical protein
VDSCAAALAFFATVFTTLALSRPPDPPPARITLGDFDQPVAEAVLAAAATPGTRDVRVDTFDRRANRTGYILVNPRTGRFDRYDVNSRHTGSGTITPPPTSGTVSPRLRFDWVDR